MNIQFLGAAGQVTGSMTLINYGGKKILVDCGQFQGTPLEEAKNYDALPFVSSEIDCVLLTHAHIDHSGRIPLLVKRGFSGKIFCTPPTSHLVEILLKDSGKIHETEAAWENKKRERAGLDPIDPLFTEDDAIESFQYLYPQAYHAPLEIFKGLTFTFMRAGHLLGSSILKIDYRDSDVSENKTLVFSGDLGNGTNLLELPPETINQADHLVVESTYGGRLHTGIETRADMLAEILVKATERGGTVLIPSFAVGRTQEIIFELNQYIQNPISPLRDKLSRIPIYIDSPLALEATKIYEKHIPDMGDAVTQFSGSPFSMENLNLVTSVEGSIALNKSAEPKVIVSASGMCEAGRITHHLKHNLWRASTHVIFIGYQAEGTLGRQLLDGVKEVKVLDTPLVVKATLHDLHGFSGHADEDHLLAWVSNINGLKNIFVNHGEDVSRDGFSHKLSAMKPSAQIHLPVIGDAYEL